MLVPASNPKFGDYQAVALSLAQLAAATRDRRKLAQHLKVTDICQPPVAGPGFINLT